MKYLVNVCYYHETTDYLVNANTPEEAFEKLAAAGVVLGKLFFQGRYTFGQDLWDDHEVCSQIMLPQEKTKDIMLLEQDYETNLVL